LLGVRETEQVLDSARPMTGERSTKKVAEAASAASLKDFISHLLCVCWPHCLVPDENLQGTARRP